MQLIEPDSIHELEDLLLDDEYDEGLLTSETTSAHPHMKLNPKGNESNSTLIVITKKSVPVIEVQQKVYVSGVNDKSKIHYSGVGKIKESWKLIVFGAVIRVVLGKIVGF